MKRVILAAAVAALSFVGWSADVRDYVQKGLVAQWDGVRNQGAGLAHSADATTWVDCIGGRTFELENVAIGESYLQFAGSTTSRGVLDAAGTQAVFEKYGPSGTIEYVFLHEGSTSAIILKSSETSGVALGWTSTTIFSSVSKGPVYSAGSDAYKNKFTSMSVAYFTAAYPRALYVNGEAKPLSGENNWSETPTQTFIGCRGSGTQYPFTGKLYAIRVYDHTLTSEEVAQNYAVDVKRFVEGDTSDGSDALVVEGFPEAHGEVSPGYGVTNALVAGNSFVCSAPSEVLGSDEAREAICLGYVLYTRGTGVSDDWVEAGHDSATSFTYVHPEGAGSKLVWKWKTALGIKPKLAIVSSAFGKSEVEATVKGIGLTAESATLTFRYGTTPDCADGSVSVNVTDAGECCATLPHLVGGQSYYVKATLDNLIDTPVVSETLPFAQPKYLEHVLPVGYTKVDYVASSGEQFVDTGVNGRDGVEIRSKMEWVSVPSEGVYIGSRGENDTRLYIVYCYKPAWSFGYLNYLSGTVKPSAGVPYDVYVSLAPGDQRIVVDGVTVKEGIDSRSVDTMRPIYLFAYNYNGTPSLHCSAKCYSLQIWDRGVLKRDYMPCYSDAESAYGLYDLVSGTFSKSATTTALLGPAVSADERSVCVVSSDATSATLAIAKNASGSTLYRVDGVSYGGEDVAAWGSVADLGTVAASDAPVERTAALNAGWGESVWMTRFFLVTGTTTNWTETVIWQDTSKPVVDAIAADGIGGDRIVVTGHLASFPGGNCRLYAVVSESEDVQSHPIAGADSGEITVSKAGDFTLTLNDATDTLFVPGSVRYVQVMAVSNGKTGASPVAEVRLAGKPVLGAVTASTSRRTITVTGSLTDLGVNPPRTVELWAGDAGALAKVAETTVDTAGKSFTLTYDYPLFEHTYQWQLRVSAETANGNALDGDPTPATNAKTLDTTTYTWTGNGGDKNWTTRENWDDGNKGDSLGFPQTTAATAKFAKNADVEIDLLRSGTTLNVGTLNLGAADIDVRFHSADTNRFGLVLNGLTVPGQRSRWTLDHAFVYRAADLSWSAGSTIVLTNSAYFYINNNNMANAAGVTMILADESYLSCYTVYLGNGSTNIINNSTFYTRYDDNLGNKAGEALVRFEGTHPLWWHNNKDRYFYSGLATTAMHFDFLVPAEGYDAAPIQCISTQTKLAGNNNTTKGAGSLTVNILDESPLAFERGEHEVPLISWPKAGINTAAFILGNVPHEVPGSALLWSDNTAAPKALSAKIVGYVSDGFVLVKSNDEEFNREGFDADSGYGKHEISEGGSLTLTAPTGSVDIGDDWHADIVGWELWSKLDDGSDAMTLVRSSTNNPAAGENTYTCHYTHEHYSEFVWLWARTRPLGFGSGLSRASSAVGESDVAVEVSGLGYKVFEGSLTFAYGQTTECSDGTVTVPVDGIGEWRGTIPRLRAGTTYYVKATLSNSQGEGPVESDVFDFVQPEVAEPGVDPRRRADMPAGFAQMEKLVSTGAEYIVTDIVPPSGTMSAEAEFGDMTFGQSTIVFGQETYAAKQYMFGITDYNGSGEVFAFWGAGTLLQTAPNRMPADPGCDYSVRITPTSSNNGTITVSNKTQGTSATITDTLVAAASKKLQIFRSGDQTHNVRCALYSARFASGGTLLGDFVPAYEPATGKVGLYDFFSGKLYPSETTPFARQRFVSGAPLELLNGQFVMKVPASDTVRTAVLCWGETYAGVGTWEHESEESVAIPAYATTVSFPNPTGWGSSVWFARVRVDEGDDALWSKTMMPEPAAPLGMNETLSLASSTVGSCEIAATVTGIGLTANEATLTFSYGTASNALDNTVRVTVTDAGVWSATILRLQPGTTYYVKATLSNGEGDTSVESDVLPFAQPESDGQLLPFGYVKTEYVESSGNQYVNTKVNARDGLEVRTTMMWKSVPDACGYLAAMKTGDTRVLPIYCYPAKWDYGYRVHNNNTVLPLMANVIYDVCSILKPGDQRLVVNGVTALQGTDANSIDIGIPLYLFALNNSGSAGYNSSARCYSLKIWEQGELTRDYVPCYSKADSAYGLYDMANGEFCKSGNANELLGPEVPADDRGIRIAFVGAKSATLAIEKSASASTLYRVNGSTYGGEDAAAWDSVTEIGQVAASGADLQQLAPFGDDWGEDAYLARFFLVTGTTTNWSGTTVWQPAPPIAMDKTLSLASSAFGSSDIAATVTGIGETASSATLTFHYGSTPDCADGTVEVTVTDAGSWSGTLPYLQSGKTYYVKATLSNDDGESVTSDADWFFVQPVVEEANGDLSSFYMATNHLVAWWDGVNNAGMGQHDASAMSWTDLSGHGRTLGNFLSGVTWTENAFATPTTGYKLAAEVTGIGMNDYKAYEIVFAADREVPSYAGLVFGIGGFKGLTLFSGASNKNRGFQIVKEGRFFLCDYDIAGKMQQVYTDFDSNNSPDKSYYNGTSLDFVSYNEGWTQSKSGIGYYNNTSYPFYGRIGALRLYDRQLTDAEREWNLAVDRARFAGGPSPFVLELKNGQFVLTVPASELERTAYLCSGATYGGTNGWTTISSPVTIPVGDTTVEFNLPPNWGTTEFFARARIGEGDAAVWSTSYVWQDPNIPAVVLGSLDGVGGDTLLVKGKVDSLGGSSCTLTAYVGPDENSLTNVWANVDGSIRTDTGDFTLTLFGSDKAASRYLKPGETYFVRVVATSANGKVAWSSFKSVTMASGAAFKSQSAAVLGHTMTVTASMADLGMTGATVVELWVGESASSLAKADSRVVTAANENFTLTATLAEFEKDYFWQLKAVNTSEGGTASTTVEGGEPATKSAPDAATYTWTGAGGDNKWTTAANWSDNKSGDCLGYPQSANATAVINKNADIEIDLPRSGTTVNVGSLHLGTADIDVRFHSADTNSFGLVLNELTVPGKNARWTLDHAFVYRADNLTWSAGSTILLKNAANLYINNCNIGGGNISIRLQDESRMSVNTLYTGGGSTVVVSDSTFETRGNEYLCNAAGESTIRFEGTHPKWRHYRTGNDGLCYVSKDNAANSAHFDFLVPVDGYESVPFETVNVVPNYYMGSANNLSGENRKITINVLPESPAARVNKEIATPLVFWGRGIGANVVTGTLPNETGADEFVWSDKYMGTDTEKFCLLSATIVGSTHEHGLTVAGVPEEVLGEEISIGYGNNDDGEPKTLTAPAGTVEFADGTRRATCLGWKLYDMDFATHEATPNNSGDGNSYSWTSPGHWQKFEWRWLVESKVTVVAPTGVTVTEPERWVPLHGSVTIPVACVEGTDIATVEGGVYTGDAIVVGDVTGPVTVTMTTGDAWYVKTDGDDGKDGRTRETAFATMDKALASAQDGDTIRVAAGEYAPTGTMTVARRVTVLGAGRDETVFRGGKVTFIAMSMTSADARIKDLSIVGYTNSNHSAGCGVNMTGGTLENVRIAWIRQGYGEGRSLSAGTGIRMSGGTVTNCVVEDCLAWGDYGGTSGIGIYMSGGTVVDCDILQNARKRTETNGSGVHVAGATARLANCRIIGNNSGGKVSGNTRGMGVCQSNGLVEDCLIVSNDTHGVLISGGTMRNCLVAGHKHTSTSFPSGVEMSGGTMENCTVADNSAPNAFAGLKMTGGTAVNNIIYANGTLGSALVSGGTFKANVIDAGSVVTTESAEGNLVADPKFADVAVGNFSIGFDSPAVDSAVPLADVTHDLAGVARPQGAAPDIGCYEFVPSEGVLQCAIVVKTTMWRDDQPPTAEARVVGGSGIYTYAWYVDGELTDQTGAKPVFEGLACGWHSLKVVVSDGVSSVTQTADDAFTLRPREVWVDLNGSNDYPYDTPAKAAHSVNEAFDAVWSENDSVGVVHVAAGEYPITKRLDLLTPYEILGAGRDETVFRGGAVDFIAVAMTTKDSKVKDLSIVGFTNSNLQAGCGVNMTAGWLENVRIAWIRQGDGQYASPASGTGLCISGGTATNCVVEDCRSYGTYGTTSGIGVRITGGTLVDSVIRRNDRLGCPASGLGVVVGGADAKVIRCHIAENGLGSADSNRGMGLSISAGLVEDCVIVSNSHHAVSVSGGTLRNCLVTGHAGTSASYTAGVEMSGGTMENCTVADNSAPNAFAGLSMTGGTAVNNIIAVTSTLGAALVSAGTFDANIVDEGSAITAESATGNLVTDPCFRNPSAGDFTVGFTSPAVDAGVSRAGVTHDLVGTVRPQGAAPDIGCYEFCPSEGELECAIIVKTTAWRGDQSPTAEARVAGGSGTYTYAWYVDGELTDQTGATPAFEGLACGWHSLKVVVSDGVSSVTQTADNAFTLRPREVWVDLNGSDDYPYDTPAKAAHSVNEAFDVVWSENDSTGVVHVAAGEYPITKRLDLLTPYEILGAGRDETVFRGGAVDFIAVAMTTKDSKVKDLSIVGFTNSNFQAGCGVNMTAGWLENVRIAWIRQGDGQYASPAAGTGLCISGGMATNCVIENCQSYGTYGTTSAIGVYITGGTLVDSAVCRNDRRGCPGSSLGIKVGNAAAKVVRCRIAENGLGTTLDSSRAMGLSMSAGLVENCVIISNGHHAASVSGGTLRNCLVAGHVGSDADYTAGVEMSGGTIVNCTLAGNTNTAEAAVSDLKMSGGTAKNTIARFATVTGGTADPSDNCFNEPVAFKSPARNKFMLTAEATNCIDKGDDSVWDGIDDPRDLAGRDRIFLKGKRRYARVDIGCYEFSPAGTVIIVR